MVNETRNPAHEYVRWQMPYFFKTRDNWEEWNAEEKYNRTLFIGVDDRDQYHITAALYMIYAGKVYPVVGNEPIDTIDRLSKEVSTAIAEVQALLEQTSTIIGDLSDLDNRVKALAIQVENTLEQWNVDSQALLTQMQGILQDVTERQADVTNKEASAVAAEQSATASASAALQSEQNASASETEAKTARDAAVASATEADTHAQTATSYAVSARFEAQDAAKSASAAEKSEQNARDFAQQALQAAVVSGSIGDVCLVYNIDESVWQLRYLDGSIVERNDNTKVFFEWAIALSTTHPEYFCTEQEWQDALAASENGVCGKFVIDSVQGTLRLPKYATYVTVGANGVTPAKGNGKTLGWTTGTANYGATLGAAVNSSRYYCGFSETAYDKELGSAGQATALAVDSAWAGITAEKENSGIVSTTDALVLRYAIRIATDSKQEVNAVSTIEVNRQYTLLECKHTEEPLFNASWLLSDGTFKSAGAYPTVWEALLVEHNNNIPTGSRVTLPSGVEYVKRFKPRWRNLDVLNGATISQAGMLVCGEDGLGRVESIVKDFGKADTWKLTIRIDTDEVLPAITETNSFFAGIGNEIGAYFYRATDNTVKFAASSNGSSYNLLDVTSAVKLEPSKTFYFRMEFTGTQYILSYSEDGKTWTAKSTTNQTVKVFDGRQLFYLGKRPVDTNAVKGMKFFLPECTLEMNGKFVVQPTFGTSVQTTSQVYDDYDFVLDQSNDTFRLPIKSRLASGSGIVGNGMVVGFTSEGYVGGTATYDGRLLVRKSDFGSKTGIVTAGGTFFRNEVSTGLVERSMGSGIETSNEFAYLYYFVGEAVQNAALIDAGRFFEGGLGVTTITETAGTIPLKMDTMYLMNVEGATTFSLPTPVNASAYHQIKVMVKTGADFSINFGTAVYFGCAKPYVRPNSYYDLYFDWDGLQNSWVVGAVQKGEEINEGTTVV